MAIIGYRILIARKIVEEFVTHEFDLPGKPSWRKT